MTTPVTNNGPIVIDIDDIGLRTEDSKILIFADDYDINRRLFASMAIKKLKDISNVFILCVDDGDKVIPILKVLQNQCDRIIVVLDEEMPGMLGSETAIAARKINFELPIFSYSSSEEMYQKNQTLSLENTEGRASSNSKVSLPPSPERRSFSLDSPKSLSFSSEAPSDSSFSKTRSFLGRAFASIRRLSAKSSPASAMPSPSSSSPASAMPSPSNSRSPSISTKSPVSTGELKKLFNGVFIKPEDIMALFNRIIEEMKKSSDENYSKS